MQSTATHRESEPAERPQIHSPDPTILKTFRLDDQRRDALARAFSGIAFSPYGDTERFSRDANIILTRILSEQLVKEVVGLRDYPFQPDVPVATYIQNLPCDPRLPVTPYDGGRATGKPTFISEAHALGLAAFLGHFFGYRAEKKGECIHNIAPTKSGERSMSNESSKVDFGFHVDNAALTPQPDFFVLSGVRQDQKREARTAVVAARTLCQRLDDATLTALREADYEIPAPVSFQKARGRQWSKPVPILTGSLDSPELCFKTYGVRALSPRGQRALEEVHRALQLPGVIQHIALGAGEALIINNRAALHGRSTFSASFDGKDRWIQRVYVMRLDTLPWKF